METRISRVDRHRDTHTHSQEEAHNSIKCLPNSRLPGVPSLQPKAGGGKSKVLAKRKAEARVLGAVGKVTNGVCVCVCVYTWGHGLDDPLNMGVIQGSGTLSFQCCHLTERRPRGADTSGEGIHRTQQS